MTEPNDDPEAEEAPLPIERLLPEDGFWPYDFSALVDRYAAAHGVTKAETYQRIADRTGNSVKGISLRYYKGRRR